MAKGKRSRRIKADNDKEELVNPFAARQGEYREALVVDLNNELGGGRQQTYRVVRNLYPSTVDRWLAEGGPGFEEPQRRAIEHCRALWHRVGGQGMLVANLNWVGGGSPGRERGFEQAEALAQLAQYESRIPRTYWMVFENVVRNDFAAGTAGSHMAKRSGDCIAHAKNSVGFVASLIAQWRGL